MTTLITVPMKDPARGKTRLAGRVSDRTRCDLARLLYRRTLEFLAPVAAQIGADVAVVTCGAEARSLARRFGALVVEEPPPGGLSEAVRIASIWARRRGYDRFCVIPADLVAPAPQDLLRFLRSPADVTICPSADQGTNALLLSPPDAIDFHYGPRSAPAHFAAAAAVGLAPAWMPLASLGFDLDSADCLDRAMAEAPDIRAVCRGETRAVRR